MLDALIRGGLIVDGTDAPGRRPDVGVVNGGVVELRPHDFVEAQGVENVLVNGEVIVRSGAVTGACPGRVMRGGRDTR